MRVWPGRVWPVRVWAVGSLLAAGLAAQGEPAPVFVEVDSVPASVWLQQPVELTVRIGVDAAWFAASSVPLFQQRLDQPFHVVVPWLQAAEERAVELLPAPAGARTQRIAVGDRVVDCRAAGARAAGARTYDLLELRCRWLPLAAGTSTVAPVQVRYAFAEHFDSDVFGGRQPRDRHEATVESAVQQLVVRALPPGPPPGFGGAVGTFTVRAAAAVSAVAAGSTFRLEVTVTGDGNLDRFAALSPPRLPGFHVQGVVDTRAAGVRTFVLDVLALRAGVEQVPPVPFVAFAPATGTWVTHAAGPVPLRVGPAPPGAALPLRVRELMDADARAMRANEAAPWWRYALAFVALAMAAAVVRVRRRQRARAHARGQAQQQLATALAGEPAAAVAAFDEALAAALGAAAWPGASGWTQLASQQVPQQLLAELQHHRAQLDAARFGGALPAAAAVLAAIDKLHADHGAP